jgi:hypothetical protein
MYCILRNKTNALHIFIYTFVTQHIKQDLLEKMIQCNRTRADVIKRKAHTYHMSWFGFQLNSLVLLDFFSSYDHSQSVLFND